MPANKALGLTIHLMTQSFQALVGTIVSNQRSRLYTNRRKESILATGLVLCTYFHRDEVTVK